VEVAKDHRILMRKSNSPIAEGYKGDRK